MIQINSLSFHPVSENSLLITWPEKISPAQHQQIIAIENKVKTHFGEALVETTVSYNALIIYYHFDRLNYQTIQSYIEDIVSQTSNELPINSPSNTIVEIPVYYGEDAGWDIAEVARRCNMTIDQVITTHSQAQYRAYALGFTPGFCYLASIDSTLILPRKKTPRLQIPQGAVAIAEQQTAVYPCVSPGGWHILGQTPLSMYQVKDNDFIPKIHVGQQVQFNPINKHEFIALGGVVTPLHKSEGKLNS